MNLRGARRGRNRNDHKAHPKDSRNHNLIYDAEEYNPASTPIFTTTCMGGVSQAVCFLNLLAKEIDHWFLSLSRLKSISIPQAAVASPAGKLQMNCVYVIFYPAHFRSTKKLFASLFYSAHVKT